ERDAQVLDHHERFGARHRTLGRMVRFGLVEAEQTLLFGLGVGVLDEDGQGSEGIAFGAGPPAGLLVDQVQLFPRPAFIRPVRFAGHLALDGGRIEHAFFGASNHAVEARRAVAAHDTHRMPVTRREAERPQQPGREHFGIPLAVVAAELHFQLIVLVGLARELRRLAAEFVVYVRAADRVARLERLRRVGSGLWVHGRKLGSLPDLGASDDRRSIVGRRQEAGEQEADEDSNAATHAQNLRNKHSWPLICSYSSSGGEMAVLVQRNLGFLLLAIFLVLYGLAGMMTLGLPPILMAVLALLAGILILLGR